MKLRRIVSNSFHGLFFSHCLPAVITSGWVSLALVGSTQAQPTIVSTVPGLLTTGVSPSAAVVFTFSTEMDTNATSAQFADFSSFPPTFYPTEPSWNTAGTILTCTPNPAFPSNKQITWVVDGQDTLGNSLGGQAGGIFTTGSGSTTTPGSGTNAITTFSVGEIYSYSQLSSGNPTLNADAPFLFNATTALASNRTATAISLTLPNSAVSNLNQNPFAHENYNLFGSETDSNTFVAAYPAGTYTFNVTAATSNQSVSITLPAGATQPNGPHVKNFDAAQAVNASQVFTLSWDQFAGGTSTDFISVSIGNVWQTPDPGSAGALNGSATSVTIPAGTLQPGTTNTATVGFYHATSISNITYATSAYRASITEFNLITSAGAVGITPVLTNAFWSGGLISFDIDTSPGQALTIVSSPNAALPLSQWQTLLATNSPGARIHITQPTTAPMEFYRVKNGF
jgi:hypothetical protein